MANMKEKHDRIAASRELQVLDSSDLMALILDTVDPKTLSVMTTSLKVARERGERETGAARMEARRRSS